MVTVADDLVGLHGSEPSSVFLSAAARLRRPASTVAALEHALYEERTLVRTLGMRRTLFVVPVELVAVLRAACTDRLVTAERRRLTRMIADAGIASDPAAWVRRVEAATLAALRERGAATGLELSKAVPGLGGKLSFGGGKPWGGTVGVSTRVLYLLSTEQRVARGRPAGSWTSSRYRWSPIEVWLPEGVPSVPAGEARAALARRYLAAFGPATTADIQWWTGWPLALTRAAVTATGAAAVDLEEGSGWVLPDDAGPPAEPDPWVALLPTLDPTTMGWRDREWYLGDRGDALFDRNGNAGPTVWADGRIVGGWAQRPDGEVVYELLSDLGREVEAAVAEAAAATEAWLGDVRLNPRFPGPLQTELARG